MALWCSLVDPHPPIAIHEPYYSMYRGQQFPAARAGDWVNDADCPFPHRYHASGWGGRIGEAERQDAAAVYAGMITNLDHQLGRLFGMMQQLGMWENTLVIYTTDHGEMLGDHGDAGKSSFYRAASDIPFLVRGPRQWNAAPGQLSQARVGLCDLLPTLVSSAGGELPDDVEGKDLAPLVRGEQARVRDYFIGGIDGRYLVADDHYRWLYHSSDGTSQCFADDDPSERSVLPPDSERDSRMAQRLIDWLSERKSADVADGRLVNHETPQPDEATLRSMNYAGWGAPGRYLSFRGPV
jgi:arylsulfatase A-like enzyme